MAFPTRRPSPAGPRAHSALTAKDTRHDRSLLLDHPNGHKITLFEETGLPYRIHPVNISKGDQFKPEFLAIAPNNRIPAIVDQAPADGGGPLSLFESGAILLYLAEKTGRFLPADLRGRQEVSQWLFWQMGGLGPMAGQNHHFSGYAPERIPMPSNATSRKPTACTAC